MVNSQGCYIRLDVYYVVKQCTQIAYTSAKAEQQSPDVLFVLHRRIITSSLEHDLTFHPTSVKSLYCQVFCSLTDQQTNRTVSSDELSYLDTVTKGGLFKTLAFSGHSGCVSRCREACSVYWTVSHNCSANTLWYSKYFLWISGKQSRKGTNHACLIAQSKSLSKFPCRLTARGFVDAAPHKYADL